MRDRRAARRGGMREVYRTKDMRLVRSVERMFDTIQVCCLLYAWWVDTEEVDGSIPFGPIYFDLTRTLKFARTFLPVIAYLCS